MVKSSMNEIERTAAAVDGPVVSEGGRRPSTLSPGQSAPATRGGAALGPLGPNQRWSATRKREVVLRLLRGELTVRRVGVALFQSALERAFGLLAPLLKLEQRQTELAREQLGRLAAHQPQHHLALARRAPALAGRQRAQRYPASGRCGACCSPGPGRRGGACRPCPGRP